jgi:hypothetical protein
MIMTLSMTRWTKSYAIRDIVSKVWIRCEWLDVVRVQFNSSTVAFVVFCAAVLAGVIISLEYRLTPLDVLGFSACYVVLVGFVDMPCPFSFIGFLGRGRSNGGRNSFSTTNERAILPLPSLLFVLGLWFAAVLAGRGYLHAVVANAFSVSLLVALKAFMTNKARLTNSTGRRSASGVARMAITRSWFIELGDLRTRFAAIFAGRKVGLIAGWADSIISRVVSTYSTSVLHALQYITNRPFVQFERMSQAFPALTIQRIE